MKTAKETLKLTIIAALAVFASSWLGNSYAKSMYYFTDIPGLIDNPNTFPFCETENCVFDTDADIDFSIPERLLTTDSSTQVSNPYVLTINDGSSVNLTPISSDETIVSSSDITASGGVITIPTAAIKTDGSLKITVSAFVDGEIAGQDYFNVEISGFSCNSNPLGNIYNDGSAYLIGKMTAADTPSSTVAKQQLLCLSKYQNGIVANSSNIYKLTADVTFFSNPRDEDWDLNGVADGSGTEGWTPLGYGSVMWNSTTGFLGTFEGNGHTISNLYINRPSHSDSRPQGFFGSIAFAAITNLNLENIDITANNYVGALFGNSGHAGFKGILDNISINGGNISGNNYVGGMGGKTDGSHITNSQTDINISANSEVGGFVGYSYLGDVLDSSSAGTVTGNGSKIGGVFGYTYLGVAKNISSTSNVEGANNVGGIVGHLKGELVENCNTNGTVTGADNIGGIVGLAEDPGFGGDTAMNTNSSAGTVTGVNKVGGVIGYASSSNHTSNNSSATVTATGEYVGGLIGNTNRTVSSSFATGSVTGTKYVGGLAGYAPTINSSYATGGASGNGGYVGGLAGNSSSISQSYAKGTITAQGESVVGGLTGGSTNVSNSYANTSISASNTSIVGGLSGVSLNVTDSYATGTISGGGPITGTLTGYTYSWSESMTVTILNSYSLATGPSDNIGSIGYEDMTPSSPTYGQIIGTNVEVVNAGDACESGLCSIAEAKAINGNWGSEWLGTGTDETPSLDNMPN